MRSLTMLALAIAVIFLIPTAVYAQPFDVEVVGGNEAVAKEALVKFRPGGASALPRVAAAADAIEAVLIGRGESGRIRSRTFNVVALMQLLRFDPDVELVEPNYIVRTTVDANDSFYGLLWGLKNTGQTINNQVGVPGADIDAAKAWDFTTGSDSYVIGVVDTGVDYLHPDLAGNIWSAPDLFDIIIGGTTINCAKGTHGFNAITKTCDPMDDNDHGSHTSGTIGATGNNGTGVTGVNWTTSIMGLKFLNADGSGSTSDAINAIEFAIQAKTKFGPLANVRVLNNSWGGGGYSDLLRLKIAEADVAGMLFVASAGNSRTNTDRRPSYPASYEVPNVISVAATDNRDALASFSNYGATSVDLGAPGVYIASTIPGPAYAYMSGTSMAAPHVSGVAALVLAKCPDLTTEQLKSNLLGTVDPVSALVGKTVTGGRLNAYNALNSCSVTPPPPPNEESFDLSISPGSTTVTRPADAVYTIAVTPLGGFTGGVALSVSGLPPNSKATFSPTTITGPSWTSKLTIDTTTKTKLGTRTFTVTGTSGSLVKTATATITVN